MSRRADAIIIGAGVIGAATAFELCKRGYKTLNIDKLPASGYGPTSNSCAIVRAHYSSLEGVAMAYEGFAYWQDWERYLGAVDDMGTARYMQCGTVLLKSATGHHEKVLTHYRDLGVEYEEWDNATLVEKVPVYSTDAFWPPRRPDDPHFWDEPQGELDGAIFTPGSGYVNDPQLATHNLQRAAEAKGGEFLFRAEVAEIRRAGDPGLYFRPESGNNILIGSEDPDCDPRVWVDEPDKFDRHVTEQQWEAQVFRLARRMPSLRIPNERKGIVDLYDVSDDWIPIYDRSVLDGFYMAIGTSGNPFKTAPVVGHLMPELIDRVEHGHDHDADPVQVRCAYNEEIVLDAGFYSRRREVNPNSSFSVNG